MCGRYALSVTPEQMLLLFDLAAVTIDLVPRYNIAPTQLAPIVRLGTDGRRELVLNRWGLIPRWAKEPSIAAHTINARCETVAEKPVFRDAMRHRRCLVPADGFFEWQRIDSRTKQPYFIHRGDGMPICMAGLWESWRDPSGGEAVETFTILTTRANGFIAKLHERMPVIVEPGRFESWLQGGEIDEGSRAAIFEPAPDDLLTMHAVDPRVGSVANDDPTLVTPFARPPATSPKFDQPSLFD